MRFVNLSVLLCLSVVIVPAQKAPLSPPDLVIQKKHWTKIYPPVGGDRDPFAPNDMAREQILAARDAAVINRERVRSGDTLVKPRSVRINTSSLSDLKPGAVFYTYTLTLKNVGNKTVRALQWAYVFIDPATDEQLGRTNSVSITRIRPGKTTEVVAYSNNHPTQVINAKTAGSRTRPKEAIEITRVEYADGSHWQRLPD